MKFLEKEGTKNRDLIRKLTAEGTAMERENAELRRRIEELEARDAEAAGAAAD